MPLQTVEVRRLYRQIADQLRVLIDSGEIAAGSRLPAERDLATQLGVSRPTVREALIALEVEGLIEVRMGSGIYAATPVHAVERVVAEAPLETLRARELIESELAARAALSGGAALLQGLDEALQLMQEDVDSGQVPTRGDRLFHVRIAQAAENSVLLRIVGELFEERHNPLGRQLGTHFETADNWAQAVAEHRAVLCAIRQGSAELARQAMREHLRNSHDRFTASLTRPT